MRGALRVKIIKTSKAIEALQVKITSHLHKASTTTEEEDKKDIIAIYNHGRKPSLKPILHGQPSTERNREKDITGVTRGKEKDRWIDVFQRILEDN